jgi:hypothetical protein
LEPSVHIYEDPVSLMGLLVLPLIRELQASSVGC